LPTIDSDSLVISNCLSLILFGGKLNKSESLLVIRTVFVDDANFDRVVGLESGLEMVFGGSMRNATDERSIPLPGLESPRRSDEKDAAINLNIFGCGKRGIVSSRGLKLDEAEAAARPLAIDPPGDDSSSSNFAKLTESA
jgi:hypothetical protein